VREVERMVERRKPEENPEASRGKALPAKKKSRDDEILEEKLSETLGAPVSLVVGRRGKGKIVIDFANLDDLEAIVQKIVPEK